MPYEEQFSALSNPLRQKILLKLKSNTHSVRELTDYLNVSQPVVSQHLKVLKNAGFVSAIPVGMKRLYKIEPKGLEELRSFLEDYWSILLAGIDADAKTDLGNSP